MFAFKHKYLLFKLKKEMQIRTQVTSHSLYLQEVIFANTEQRFQRLLFSQCYQLTEQRSRMTTASQETGLYTVKLFIRLWLQFSSIQSEVQAGTLPAAVTHGKENETTFIKAFLRFQRGCWRENLRIPVQNIRPLTHTSGHASASLLKLGSKQNLGKAWHLGLYHLCRFDVALQSFRG